MKDHQADDKPYTEADNASYKHGQQKRISILRMTVIKVNFHSHPNEDQYSQRQADGRMQSAITFHFQQFVCRFQQVVFLIINILQRHHIDTVVKEDIRNHEQHQNSIAPPRVVQVELLYSEHDAHKRKQNKQFNPDKFPDPTHL